MNPGSGYEDFLESTASRIRRMFPENIGELFEQHVGVSPGAVNRIAPLRNAALGAIDGSNTAILESGSLTISGVRAGAVLFREGETERRRTPLFLVFSGGSDSAGDFSRMYAECFGNEPIKSLEGDDVNLVASLARDTLEYWVALQTLDSLGQGDLLVLDGALRVSHESHNPVLAGLLGQACRKGVVPAAVAKRTTATFAGGYPLLPAVSSYTGMAGIPSPWWMKVDEGILDQTRFSQWQHGEVYIASLHPYHPVPLKVELPRGLSAREAGQAMAILAGCADDGRIPGYPFPLLDAHRTVVISEAVAGQIRQDILAALSRQGFDSSNYAVMFGDYHDEFRRY